ncbi:LuxR C-terminal-related transcriptional regulator [Mycobacterium sp. 852002-40037_SCH5390672]|uniref:LuxR C-terminal-related transcriptional regulator n=1 Tax=Mycobacterium sp. 852002-40037_SCH5390672 TaxID=1834089 RepID=UPI000805C01C|nr:LuxR C-terminal-related transcriptional regulator [Mycobacterium sp. 852002-40037_SCH5390672]OBB99388.1 transcriptional regulator [Mycobacterium sp. 852002-40037_SCH5390672]
MNGLLPTGTVTLLLADVEGSTRLWETQPAEMTAAIARLNVAVPEIIVAHDGVRPVEQGEGDSFVAAFARASDALAAALALQQAPLAPIRLRVGIHTGEVQLRDEGNYVGPTINRTARLRDLGHGGQTVLSGATEPLVVDRLPEGAWLTELGTHVLRDLPRPERVVQLCHPDLINEFPPLRVSISVVSQHLPVQLTRFVGRDAELAQLRELLADNRLVTLTGAGGVGKTRLAVQVAAQLATEFGDGAWYADLAAITDRDVVPIAVARALGLPDQPSRSTMDTLTRFVADRHMLVVLDNCEHLLDASAALIVALLGAGAKLTLLATSREAIGVAGEMGLRVPSLSLVDEALELFADRARHVRPDFVPSDDDAAAMLEICRRLDGVPLAIELAAARVRALSLAEIVDSLHDRFRLLTGGARTAVRRQQTMRASVDWSHALLTLPEQVLFRRLAVFMGGFDLDAAQFVCGGTDVERYQVLDQLTLLVDKSLVVAEDSEGRTHYRLLETVRQYAQEKLVESGEADTVRTRHRDHYTTLAVLLDAPAGNDHEQRIEQAETEIDNLRAAFGWSCEKSDIEPALTLASALQPLWMSRGRLLEGLDWFDTVLTEEVAQDAEVATAVRSRALADEAVLAMTLGAAHSADRALQALALAREVDDPAVLARALSACGFTAAYNAELAGAHFAEALKLARELDDKWRLSQILTWQASAAVAAGDPIAARAAAEEGRDLADALGDGSNSRHCRMCLGIAQLGQGDLAGAVAQFGAVAAEAQAAHDGLHAAANLAHQGTALAWHGETDAARDAADASLESGSELGGIAASLGYFALANAALAAGDVETALGAAAAAWEHGSGLPGYAAHLRPIIANVALAGGDLIAARRWADEAVATAPGFILLVALSARARVATAQGEPEQAEHDAHDALASVPEGFAYPFIPDILECLGTLAGEADSHREAARLFGAAAAIRQRIGAVRFKVWDADYEASVAALREAMGDDDFDVAWAEGAALSTEEAIAYAQRGRGQRKRPATGWASLTPTERDVVRLVSQGLANNDIATRLFVSPRTVQTHLTHVYTKLGLSSRVQLAQEATHHA